MKQLLYCFIVIAFSTIHTIAQTDFPIGSWKSHLPYRIGRYVSQSDTKIYYATDLSVLSLDKEDLSVQFFSTVNGLSNVRVKLVKYSRFNNTLMVVYENSVIDLIKENEILTISNIKNFNNIVGNKTINDLFIEDGPNVYLAADYGVSKLDIEKGLFVFTTFTGVKVKSVLSHQGKIYAATEEGIYSAAENNLNLDDFGNWNLLDEADGFPQDYTSQNLAIYNDEIYLDINDSLLYKLNDNQLTRIHQEEGFSLKFLSAEGEHLLAGFSCGNCNGKVLYFNQSGLVRSAANDCVNRPLYAIEDEKGNTWFADAWRDYRYSLQGEDFCKRLSFNSPFSKNVTDIAIMNDEVWIAAGGVTTQFNYLFRSDGFFSLIDGNWQEYNRNNQAPLQNLFDFYKIAIHPENGNPYIGSFLDGLAIFEKNEFVIYDDSNSSLNNATGDLSRTRVSGLAFDGNNNLWVSNHSAARPFSIFANDGEWYSFKPSCTSEKEYLDVVVDNFGYAWFIIDGESAGVLVYDTQENLANPSDDRCKVFTAGNSGLPTNSVNSIAVDLEGDIWVGTSDGAVVFQCGPNVFDDCDVTPITTDQDEFNLGFLLSGNDVRSIAIDGANQKWFGTTNGIFVQSADGKEQVGRFTTENSPLFDDIIIDMAINHNTGEIFIGTAEGIISYRGEATEGKSVNSKNVYAFPNPVRPEYRGPIAIKGLAQDANVKITDVNGQLIYETKAFGGQAVWDGNDYNGRRASSGVYLVFSTSKNLNNPDAIVTKILVMN